MKREKVMESNALEKVPGIQEVLEELKSSSVISCFRFGIATNLEDEIS